MRNKSAALAEHAPKHQQKHVGISIPPGAHWQHLAILPALALAAVQTWRSPTSACWSPPQQASSLRAPHTGSRGSSSVLLTKICPRTVITCFRGSPKKLLDLSIALFSKHSERREHQHRHEPPPAFALLRHGSPSFKSRHSLSYSNHFQDQGIYTYSCT